MGHPLMGHPDGRRHQNSERFLIDTEGNVWLTGVAVAKAVERESPKLLDPTVDACILYREKALREGGVSFYDHDPILRPF